MLANELDHSCRFRYLSICESTQKIFSSENLVYLIAIGAFLGGFCGWYFGARMLAWAWIGDIFLNGLRFLVVPLVMISLIAGVTQLNSVRQLGPLGFRTVIYFMITTSIAVLVGLVLVNLFQPGRAANELAQLSTTPERVQGKEAFSFIDVLTNMVPPNLFQAMAEGNIMPLIIFSLAFGILLIGLGEEAKPLSRIIQTLNEIILRMVKYFMFLAPYGIFALVASKLGKTGGGEAFWLEISRVGRYTLTVIMGLGVHGLIILPLLLMFMRTKTLRATFYYLKNGSSALLTAFGTASSSATLPVTLHAVEKKNKIKNETAGFVCTLGTTINMDGTALYEAVAAVFLAQAYGMNLSIPEQILIFLTATLASVGAAGIPEAGLITMVMVLNAVNIPLEGIGMILAVDWFLDRCRTTVNVAGDMIGAGIVDQLIKNKWRSA